MRLVSIRLNDVRRFTDPVLIDGIGAGLNVLTAPNEHGKSTVFDAVEALFTVGYRSRKQDIGALRPHAGGAPEITVELDLPEGRFTVAKRWFSRPMAEVRQNGRLLAQADEAEAWIARTAGTDDPASPTGLLWVRQGLTTLGDGKDTAEARRGLLSSVAGEVEAMTGGQRMDDALRRCTEELERHVSAKGGRTRGPLKEAEDRIAALTPRIADLESRARELHDDLDRRRKVLRALSELTDPEAVAARRDRLAQAEAAHAAAAAHADAEKAAQAAEETARLKHDAAVQKLAALRKSRAELATAAAALATAERQARELAVSADTAEATLAEARTAADAARTRAGAADALLRRAEQAEAAQSLSERRDQLHELLTRAEGFRQQAETAAAAAGVGPDARTLERLDELSQQIALHRATQAAQALGVTLRYAPGAPAVTLDGAPLPDGRRTALPQGGTLDLPGLGRMTIHPGHAASDEDVPRAEAELARALAALGVATLDEARAAARSRADAEQRRREALAQLSALAPDGIEALRARLATLPEPSAPAPALPSAADARLAAETARQSAESAESTLDEARRAAERERHAAARAAAALDGARDRHQRADADMRGADPETAEADLDRVRAACRADLDAAQTHHARLAERAPDLSATGAALERARDVAARAEEDRHRLSAERQRLDARIELLAGEAVEEDLKDLRAQLRSAEDDAARCQFEVALLRRLRCALDTARQAARDRYFEPVMRELGPLLRLVWPDAELRLDGESVLPSALLRSGAEEAYDTLSGGTREQIALLVRLAFARMLAARGRHAPVILDDALVYTDDERIEAMFNALHRQASDLQIIVLSCRQRAFRDLGGTPLELRHAPD
ncbi:chromosome segregation protein SMC [Rhodobacteraceae bacterium 2CG4]|uniref:Chromosome segregation protein SMC n=1 Tax=Halovulum marinum TaxID=2662447 RepID=A0A6L5YWJ1_9RHOB|nr:chromosome segregation protein SMC [Halovulum marinum]MSU88691.1 chromosome segregation protein SMC [Halovulum marinum]